MKATTRGKQATIAGAVVLWLLLISALALKAQDQAPGDRRGLTRQFAGQGFDKCEIAALDALQAWMSDGPYRAVNLYIGGAARACSNRALDAALVARLSEMGWKFIPTWVGPQAPCYPGAKLLMSADPATAHAQGIAEADAAAEIAAGLGLARTDGSGAIIYYDIERYDVDDAACNAAVKAFVAGWVEQLHARGNLAGVYGNGPTLSELANLAAVPDAVWAAHWIDSGYNPAATPWDVYRLSNDLWVNHQRIRQYAGSHAETWGGATLVIDSNVIDGVVADVSTLRLPHGLYLPLLLSEGPG